MALIRCDFYSDVLELSTSMTVILPQAASAQMDTPGIAFNAGPHPVLYLLHGLSDDDTVWLRRTSIERYAEAHGLAVVMPQVHRSFYADEVHGGRYWTFLSVELPQLVGSFFPISRRREDTFVAGLSMGGYGALKWALREPHRFTAAASLSGALDIASAELEASRPELFDRVFGDRSVVGTPNDLVGLLQSIPSLADLPALYVACGLEDELVTQNRRFIAAAEVSGVPLTTRLTPGSHEWGYWDAEIQRVLSWQPLEWRGADRVKG
jgi:S-formylglutathione hydrolase FrmB